MKYTAACAAALAISGCYGVLYRVVDAVLKRRSHCQIQAHPTYGRVAPICHRGDSVIGEALRSAPDEYIAMRQRQAMWPVGALQTAKQKRCLEPQGYGNDRC